MTNQIFLLFIAVFIFFQQAKAFELHEKSIEPELLQNLPFQKLNIVQHQEVFYLTMTVPINCINKLTPSEKVYKDRLYISLQTSKECLQSITDSKNKKLTLTTLKLQTAPSKKIVKFLYHSDSLVGYSEIEIQQNQTLEANTCQNCSQQAPIKSTNKDEFKKIKNVLAKEAFEQAQHGNLKPKKYFSILGQALLSDGLEYGNFIIADEYSQAYGTHTAHDTKNIDYKLFLDEQLGVQISLFSKPDSIITQQNISLGMKKDIIDKNSAEFFSKYSSIINKNSFFELTTQIEKSSLFIDKKIDLRYNFIF